MDSANLLNDDALEQLARLGNPSSFLSWFQVTSWLLPAKMKKTPCAKKKLKKFNP
jgi:hypothetical protein